MQGRPSITGTKQTGVLNRSHHVCEIPKASFDLSKDENISFNGYIVIWILRIYCTYQGYTSRYFYINIDN